MRGVVEKVPGVWGGRYYMVPDSRIPVFMVANHLGWGGEDEVREMWPHLTLDQIRAAKLFILWSPELVEEDRKQYQQDTEEAREESRQ